MAVTITEEPTKVTVVGEDVKVQSTASPTRLQDLVDVDQVAPATGQVPIWDGTEFVYQNSLEPRYKAGLYYSAPGALVNAAFSKDVLYFLPTWIGSREFDRIAWNCTLGGSTVRLGVYADDGNGLPDELLVEFGIIDVTIVGGQEVIIAWTPPAFNLYHLAFVAQGAACSGAGTSTASFSGRYNITDSGSGYYKTGVFGTLPVTVETSDPGLSNNLIDYFRLGELAGVVAVNQVAGAPSGAYEGLPTLGVPSLTNDADTAVSFDGINDRVALGNKTAPRSVELWIKTTTVAQKGFFSNRFSGGNAIFLGTPGDGRLFVYNNSRGGGVYSTGPLINDGLPHHVVYTWDGAIDGTGLGTTRWYIDGVLNGSGNEGASAAPYANNPAYIGHDADNNEWWDGTIDEFQTYNIVLSDAQVADLYAYAAAQFGASSGVTPRPLLRAA